MRNWDNWISYLDNDGNLLHGKIRFCRKGTTDNITIYNSSGVAIRNPGFTDMLGRTEYQVFLEGREDVTAYFYKYIGSGQMTALPGEDYDPTRWEYQYSSDGLDQAKSIDLTATTAEGVATMDDLRAKDPQEVPAVNGAKLLWLYGYYSAGDKPPVLYYWDPVSLRNDDGGSVIQSDEAPGQGRWILASQELHFDVRHFGIFAQSDKYSVDFSYTSQLANCATFLDNRGLDAWFPDIDGNMSYYLLDGTNTFAIAGDIYCSDAVRLMCKTGTTGTIVRCHELHKRTPYLFDSTVQTGTATLVADWVNISWVGGNCTGDARVGWVIDTADFARNISDKEVVFKVNGSPSLSLTNCLVTSHGKITGNIALTRCEIRTDWFADDYDWSRLSMNNNRILLKNCKDADTYIVLKNKQQEADYGDLGEQTVTSKTLLPGSIVENAQFAGVTLQGAIELHNISGSVVVTGGAVELNAVDCWLFFGNTTSALQSISLLRGSISGTALNVAGDVLLDDVDVNIAVYSTGNATVRYSRIMSNYSVAGSNLDANGCELFGNAYVATLAPNSQITASVTGCRFLGTSKFKVKHDLATGTAFTIDIRMVGNMSDHDFVDDTDFAGYSHTVATSSTYRYDGNYGGCPLSSTKGFSPVDYDIIAPESPSQYVANNTPVLLPVNQRDNAVSLLRDLRGTTAGDSKYQVWWLYRCKLVLDTDILNIFRFKNLKIFRVVRVVPVLEAHFTAAASSDSAFPEGTPFGTSVINMNLPVVFSTVGPGLHEVDIQGDYTYQSVGTAPHDMDHIDDWKSRVDIIASSSGVTLSHKGATLVYDLV